jgi:hypothetical protein
MADTRKVIQQGATVAGGALTAVVFGLLAFLYSGKAKVEVPVEHKPLPAGHDVFVCRDTPRAALDAMDKAVAFAKVHGTVYGDVITDGCASSCNHGGRLVPCHLGAVTVTLRDGAFDDEHAGETLIEVDTDNRIVWATVLVPERLYSDVGYPRDAYAIMLTHELVGHAEGRGHTRTQIRKGVVAEKTGEVMNANLLKSGWGDAGW